MASNAEQAGINHEQLEKFVDRRIRLYQQGIKGGPDENAPRVTERDLITIWVTLRNIPGTEGLRSRIDDTVGVIGNEVCEGCGVHVHAAEGGSGAKPQTARPLETGVAADDECPKCGAPM